MRPGTIIPLTLFVFACVSVSGADMRPIKKLRAGIPPYAVMEKIARHNDQFVAGRAADKPLRTPGTPHMVWLADRKSTRLNSSHSQQSRMPSSA